MKQILLLLFLLQQDPRQIVEEAQRRTNAQSQRYEGTLQVVDARSKITEKRWQYDRIGSHGQAADGLRVPASFFDFLQKNRACQLGASGIECGGAAVDVVVAGAAGGELEFSQAEGLFGQQG